MSVSIDRLDPVSGLEWAVLRGDRADVMRSLGAEYAHIIQKLRSDPEGGWAFNTRRARRLAAFPLVQEATRRRLPVESQELTWIAEGAGVDEEELWAQNLRGDLGRDGTGCSDISLCGASGIVLGHNEDGDGDMAWGIRLITIDIDDDPAMTVVWYPGMIPANSFVTTSAGLAFGMDHVPVRIAATGAAGRHFVARHAQRQPDGAQARAALQTIPCAGGFAFDVADAPAGRVDLIENAAGRIGARGGTPGADGALRHTNHLREIDGTKRGLAVPDDDRWLLESRGRMRALAAASATASSAEEVFAALRSPGVLGRGEDLHTFTTTVIDAASDRILLRGSGALWTGRWSAFARGERVDA